MRSGPFHVSSAFFVKCTYLMLYWVKSTAPLSGLYSQGKVGFLREKFVQPCIDICHFCSDNFPFCEQHSAFEKESKSFGIMRHA